MTNPQPLEIELKLALPPHQVEAFLKRMARCRTTPVKQTLRTVYFDTPDFALSAQGVAIRLRQIGRRWLQALKTEGERQGGLSRRAEYEMPVARGAPDWSRFPADALAYVPQAVRTQLVQAFETQFSRTAWLLKGKGGARIEVALDVGEVRAGERRQPICEIELELKAGQPDALFALALEWAEAFECLPLDVSKAERGVRLAHGEEAAPVKSAPVVLDTGMRVEDGFATICQACLAQFQANLPGVLGRVADGRPQAGERREGGEGANAMPTRDPLPNPLMKLLSDPLSPQAGKSPLIPRAGEGANAGPKPIDDIEYVHQARVALRRLRAGLRLYRRVCVLPDALMSGLRTLAGTLGPARDWDVLCDETLPVIAPNYDDTAAWQRGMAVMQAHRAEVRCVMQREIRAAHPGVWLLAFQRWLQGHGWRAAPETQRFAQLSPLDKWARSALQKGHRPIVRGARDFSELMPLQRHALRIAIKRQRYTAEFFQDLFVSRRQPPYLAVLRDAQDSLGKANDAHVAWLLLTDAHLDCGPMGEFVRGWLAARQADSTAEEGARHLKNFMKLRPYW